MLKKIEYLLKNLLMLFLSVTTKKSKIAGGIIKVDSETKCLLIRLNRIGDALVTTPFINILKSNTNCKIYLLADKKNNFVFENNPDIEEVFVFDKGLNGFFRTLKIMNSKKFDVLFDMHDDVSATVSFLISFIKCPVKIGFEKSNKNIFTHTVPRPDPLKYHIVERLCSFTKLFGIDYKKEGIRIIFNPKETVIKKADEFLNNLFTRNRFLLGVNISAGSDARFWGIENYKKLIETLSEFDLNLILITHQKDFTKAIEIINSKYIFCSGDDFAYFAAIIKKLDLLFTPDTSAVHLAATNYIPVFGLYVKYKLNEVIWSPYNTDFDCIITEKPNLLDVKFDDVWSKFEKFLFKYLNEKK